MNPILNPLVCLIAWSMVDVCNVNPGHFKNENATGS